MRTLMLSLAAAALVPTVSTPAVASDSAYSGKTWRGSDGRLRCKRQDGSIGLVAGGALIGRAIDKKGERATGRILGAAAGALLGRKVERTSHRCR